MGVGAIDEHRDRAGGDAQSLEVDFESAALPVGEGANVPGIAFAFGANHEVANLAVQNAGLVPHGGYVGDELRAFRFLQVSGRCIAKHGEGCVKDHVLSQLPAACTLTHRLVPARMVTPLGSVAHRALGKVHWTGEHPDEGNRDLVGHHIHVRTDPLALFQPENALIVEHVGVGAAQSRRLVRPVEVDEEVVFGGSGGHPLVEVDHNLVVAVHEIDLESLYAHLGIVLANALHLLVHGGVPSPQHDANAFGFTIFH